MGRWNPGESVRCIDNSDIEIEVKQDTTYKVDSLRFYRGIPFLKLEGIPGFWRAKHFQKVEKDE